MVGLPLKRDIREQDFQKVLDEHEAVGIDRKRFEGLPKH